MLQMLRLLNESKLVKELKLIRYVNEGDLLYIYVRVVFIDESVLYIR